MPTVSPIHPSKLRFGKREARHDHRVPRLSKHAPGLPAPPLQSNWYADIGAWEMLGNDLVGDCVEAAILHQILQITSYVSPGLAPLPTQAEALAFYSAATGYDPTKTDADGNNPTDQGSYVLGPGGVLDYWLKTGVVCGGVLNKPSAFMQITRPNPIEWMQAINTFGSVLLGIQLPEAIVSGDTVPDVWSTSSGPVAGGHEIIAVGYDSTVPTEVRFNIISWGARYAATEDFLLAVVDEAVTVFDTAFLNKLGINPAGVDQRTLLADMAALQNES